jgi:hypothetical protein
MKELLERLRDLTQPGDGNDRLKAADLLVELATIIAFMPAKDDVELALLACNNGSGTDFRMEMCRCDPEVGCVPCQYCAEYDVLSRVFNAAEAAESVNQ